MSPPFLNEASNLDCDDIGLETHLVNEKMPAPQQKIQRFREIEMGVWTLYLPLTDSWREYLPALDSLWLSYDLMQSMPTVWKFVLETLSLGPGLFAICLISSALQSVLPAVQLYNNSKVLALVSAYNSIFSAKCVGLNPTFWFTTGRGSFQ